MEGLWQSALVISEVRCERRGSSPRSVCPAEAFAEVPAGLCDPAVTGMEVAANPSACCG